MKGFLAALLLLTSIPVPIRTALELKGSLPFFPIVGLIIGGILTGLDMAMGYFLPVELASAILLLVSILITRGMHLDGFIDTCDGLAVVGSREEKLQAMEDPRVGAFGVIGSVLVLLLKFSAISALDKTMRPHILAVFPIVGRWCMAWAVALYKPAKEEGLGKGFKDMVRGKELIPASIIALFLSFLFARTLGLSLMLISWLISIILGTVLSRSFGGMTGDTYGAINEVAETMALMAGAALGEIWEG